jgi:predicted metalloprotease
MLKKAAVEGLVGQSTWMLKSPVITSSEGEVTRLSRSEEKSERKSEKGEEGGR